ncbi:helix-turn-helix domain-containing protein [Streptomyces sp. NPDC097610]|uniref:helix-turn-helix domain-containing protein n=1 Tax=Streptomyces sp. NPDC097610 TaxID=3157227 RepID=UPI00331D6D45
MVLRARPGRDEDERTVVRRLSRARKAPRDAVMRAQMIELSWPGLRVPAIAAELGYSQKTVRCWLHRFNRSGLQGLCGPTSRPRAHSPSGESSTTEPIQPRQDRPAPVAQSSSLEDRVCGCRLNVRRRTRLELDQIFRSSADVKTAFA